MKILKEAVISGHKDSIYKLIPVNDHLFFSTGADGLVVQWNLKDPTNGRLFARLNNPSYTMAYSNAREQLVVAENFEGIHVLDINTKQEVLSRKLTEKEIFATTFVGEELWVGLSDGSVIVLDEHYNQKALLTHSNKSARTIATFGDWVAVGYSDHVIRVYAVSDKSLHYTLHGHQQSVFSLCFHPDGSKLYSVGRDARIMVWDVNRNFEKENEVVGHMYTINHLTFSPDGKHFVTCSMDKSIKLWQTDNLRLLKVIDKSRHAGHGTSVNNVFWSSYENKLVSCSDDRSISVWSITV